MKIEETLNKNAHVTNLKSVADLKLDYSCGNFCIAGKLLTSLEGSPNKITRSFICTNNKLKNLIDGPRFVDGFYQCDNNPITSLEGAPELTKGFSCSYCRLKTLKFAPKMINGSFWCDENKISSFKNIFEHIHEINGNFICHNNPIEDGLLHILLITGIKQINSPFKEINQIINDYLKQNKSGIPKAMFDVQKLIIEAKLEDVPESVYME